MYETYLEDNDNLRIVESLRKRCFTISQDDWEQFCRIIIWKAVEGYNPTHPSKAKFTSYLYTKARFEIMKYNTKLCKEQPQYIPELDFLHSSKDSFGEGQVEDLLELLEPEHRQIISLRYVYNYSIREMCKTLGIKKDTCKEKIEESVNMLREVLCENDWFLSSIKQL